MKTASQIVQSLQNQPQFQKLRTVSCIDKVLSLFLPTTKRFIKYGYIKNRTLFVVLNHNAGKQEFDNSIKMIKDVLNQFPPQECQGIDIVDIKAFVQFQKRSKQSTLDTKNTVPTYEERALGEFSYTVFNDPSLQEVAKEIAEIIRSK